MTPTFAGFQREEVEGWPVLHRRDERQKTFRVALLWQRPLDQDQAARALLPALLQHGTQKYPDRTAIARQREQLFGAAAGFAVGRHGESTLLQLRTDAVAGEFLPGRPDQFGALQELLRELLRPRLQAGAFAAIEFAREQAQALAAARAVFDDKTQYARLRALAVACAGEPYGLPDHGGEAAIAALTAAAPAAMLDDFLQHGRCVALMSGSLPAQPADSLQPLLQALPRSSGLCLPPVDGPQVRAAGRTHEHAPMQQGKLVLVYRLPQPRSPSALHALQ